jgi:methylmalonyl-CoA mutase
VFAFKREGEDPTRMFAGEGDAFRTNRRFKKVSEGMPAHRLSTAFDSVTLYGCDPDPRPDIYGKIGNSGVSIATLDDMKVLYDGFDLVNPTTSVSMTINGPAPIILAMFFNTASTSSWPSSRPTTAASPPTTKPEDPRMGARHRARHRAGRHPEGRPGPEHLHLQHRVRPQDDGRHPGVLRP